ncbi:MAG: hypothetical protein ACODAG_03750 [Myxococcota bacterium]
MTLRPPNGLFRRAVQVVATVAIAAGVIGFLTGVRRPPPEAGGYQLSGPAAAPEGDAIAAPTQAQVAQSRFGVNRTRHPEALAALADDRPALTDPVELSTQDPGAELSRRAASRAYDGAPPTIPHPIDQRSFPSCTACHAEGLRVAGKTARPMSHPPYGSCTQCHVVESRPMPFEPTTSGPPEDNAFEGTRSPVGGERAWDGAPPVIPHRTFMRERCESCHGVLATGIRTSHPWRQSCTQCHAPSAELDQRPAADLGWAPGSGGP